MKRLFLIIALLFAVIPVFGISRQRPIRDPDTRVIDSNYLWRLDYTGSPSCAPMYEDPDDLLWHYGNDEYEGVC